jgi:predicted transposase/invertase (TIGR01784 family)
METLPNPHDRFFRETFSRLEIARGFLEAYLPPQIAGGLAFETLAIAKDSFIEKELQEHFSDLLYTVQYREAPVHIYLLLEHKSHPAERVALQLLRYQVKIWEQFLKQHPTAETLPPILPLVLYHGTRRWQVAPAFQDLIAPLDEALAPYVPQFRYALYDLSRYPPEALRGPVLSQLVLLALKHIFSPDPRIPLAEILQRIAVLLEQETALEILEVILRYYVQATQRLDEKDIRALLATMSTGDDWMQTFIDRYFEQGRQQGLEQGRQQGLEQGRQQGLEEGVEQGRQQGEAALLLRQLERKFGPLSATHRQQVQEADAATLLEWSERILIADTLEEVLPPGTH